ncbi:MAG: bifunctional hydroxymethylpyrimidine kinase/phosphomethylpyrimidine kinase [Chitinophagaceae bacterium]|nr:bifunctional hydroxymethylpyrimidine kinase/phosphomethylpyrimidine kinase [Chitinophagaceae bacterium]
MNTTYTYPSVLTIAGFDGSGGAGIQADIKTISALGCYASSVLTALPVQNTQGVRSVYAIPDQAVEEQLGAIFDDILPQAIKIGMVHAPALVSIISRALKEHPGIPVVFDPVMVATSGHRLIEEETVSCLVQQLFPLSALITPNMDEAAILARMEVKTLDDMYRAGAKIQALGCRSLLLKGGHLDSPLISSLYFDEQGHTETFTFEKYPTNNTHGSGCTLSSAIAGYLARGKSLREAAALGQDYVQQAICFGADVKTGKGNGPLNHFFNPEKLIKNELV